jgi:CHAT domain-containing protein/tetratricopeptide (TPR) repeat protein
MFPRPVLRLYTQLFLSTLMLISSPALLTLRAQGITRTLEPGGTSGEREIMAGESQAYQVAVPAGQSLRLQLEQSGIDLLVFIYGPDGSRVLDYNGLGSPLGRSELALVSNASGVYKIEIRPVKIVEAAGHYRLQASELRDVTEPERDRFAAQIVTSQAQDARKLNTAEARRDAIRKYEEARVLWRKSGDQDEEAAALISMGRLQLGLAQYQKALDSLTEALNISRAVKYLRGEAQALANISNIYVDLGDYTKALDFNQQALPLLHVIGDRENEATAFSNMGLIYDKEPRDWQKALDYYNQALPIFQELGNRQREAVTLGNIGNIYRTQGDYLKALEFLRRSLPLRREAGDRQGEAATLNSFGYVYEALGENEKALDYFNQTDQIIHAVGYRRGEALALSSIARVMDKLGRTAEALDKLEESLKIVESMRGELIGEEDRATFFASTEFFYKLYIDLLMKLHGQHASAGYLDRALQANERAHARNLLEQLNEARVNLRQDVDPALLREERRIEQQINSAAQKEELQRSTYTPEQLAASQKEIAELIATYQELEARLKASSPRYTALTRPQLLGVREIQKQVLDADTLLLEYSLGAEHSYLWAVSQTAVNGFILPKRELIEGLTTRFYNLLTARAQRLKFETPDEKGARLSLADAELTNVSAELSRLLIGPVASQLGTKRLLVVSDGVLHLIPFAALSNPSNPARPLVQEHEIVSVPSASALYELRREHQGHTSSTKMVAVLADPVFDVKDERVKAVAQLGVAAIGTAAANASAGFIKAQANQHDSPKRNDSLSEVTRSARETGATAEGANIPRLPFTRQEAKAITALIPAQQRAEALDFEASRETATSASLGQYRFIHFATHGLLNSEHPELSGVVLSLVDRQGKDRDGFLRTSEIFHLKLPVEMVTLSGCRTGLGKQIGGEGMIGLTQGFMYAGAARVMVSLWNVNDQATAEFMGRFYKFMLGPQHLSPAAALRATQISIMQEKRWQSPYYWSAFVLQGEPR